MNKNNDKKKKTVLKLKKIKNNIKLKRNKRRTLSTKFRIKFIFRLFAFLDRLINILLFNPNFNFIFLKN